MLQYLLMQNRNQILESDGTFCYLTETSQARLRPIRQGVVKHDSLITVWYKQCL